VRAAHEVERRLCHACTAAPFTLEGFGRSYDWGTPPSRFIGFLSAGDNSPENTHDVALWLRSSWDIVAMQFWGWQSSATNLTTRRP